MVMITFAIVGKDNEPLYLRDFTGINSNSVHDSSDINQGKDEADPFGFFDKKERDTNESCSMNHQFIMHSALDVFEEMISLDNKRLRSRGSTSLGPVNTMWVGSLCSIENMRVYGYMTNTKIKFMATIDDDDSMREQWKITQESALKAFFSDMHDLYVQYSLNPFSKTQGSKINSKRFDNGLVELVHSFNDNCGERGPSW
eukprot:CAMPEP_0184867492 /NCGR_PEP_ID=MMETSP0580-20130426/26819_1 /TAXON_ID=1118495 /ORGANISM="Dactyliosolen fragilissimus" /LENGTH=199 /DNA_ID=CAMNT_0027367821 /DNA_START=73 /DNA_END=669 /DNA_ORIENTATION=+